MTKEVAEIQEEVRSATALIEEEEYRDTPKIPQEVSDMFNRIMKIQEVLNGL